MKKRKEISTSSITENLFDVVMSEAQKISSNNYHDQTIIDNIKKNRLDFDYSIIIPRRMYIGNERSSLSPPFDVSAFINCCCELSPPSTESSSNNLTKRKSQFPYLHVKLTDDFDQDLESHLEEIRTFIENNECVLIYCDTAISLSVTVVLSQLMLIWKMSLKDAFKLVKSCRESAMPNVHFLYQLQMLECKIFHLQTSSISFADYAAEYFFPLFQNMMDLSTLKSKIENIVNQSTDFDQIVNRIYEIN